MTKNNHPDFFAYLDKPAYKILFAGSIGLFIALFMIAFQPFGVSNYDPNFKINLQFVTVMLSLGISVAIVLLLNEMVLRPLLFSRLHRHWLFAWIGWVYMLTGSVLYLLYNVLGNWHDWHWRSYFGFLLDVGMVITIPIAAFLFFLRHRALQTEYIRLRSAPPARAGQLISFTSENGKDTLLVSLDDVLYLESEDNYVSITYLEDERPRSHLVRSTMKRQEELLDHSALVRCHRSFIVNLGRVTRCRGNRQGLNLKLAGMDGIVPVSRKYTHQVLEYLQDTSVPEAF